MICPVCTSSVADTAENCPTCGFRLVGATAAFTPVSVDEASDTPHAHLLDEALLRTIKGPQVGNAFQLKDEEISLGRSPQCDIFLNDRTVSRVHAHIRKVDGAFIIEDAQSFNGLWINGENIQTHALEQGDIIQIGTFTLRFEH
ncbi:MAG: FHA domain-containing protein [Eggerthellaceae bacterium]|nr:FHA domain-containing protein [Eggerthellaceae bacterium]